MIGMLVLLVGFVMAFITAFMIAGGVSEILAFFIFLSVTGLSGFIFIALGVDE